MNNDSNVVKIKLKLVRAEQDDILYLGNRLNL